MTHLQPDTEEALAAAISDAHAKSAALAITGGDTRRGQGGTVTSDATLTTACLSGITLYDPGALTLIAKAGTPMTEIEAVLAAESQFLPFEPMDHRAVLATTGTPTIGGVVALNASGPRRIKAGACRDSVIGARFVDGTGQLVKSGGRVMKNVTGLDLAKLMCGAHGTLGVLSEVAFKLLPAPETAATLVLHNLDWTHAVDVMSRALGTPFEVSGAAADATGTYLRVEGLDGQVRYRLAQLSKLFGGQDQSQMDGDHHAKHWRALRDAVALNDQTAPLWRISVKPSDAPGLVDVLGSDAQIQMDWGGGLIWAQCQTDPVLIRTAVDAVGGHATVVRNGPGQAPIGHPEPARIAALSAGLRRKFDPAGILNPGKMAA